MQQALEILQYIMANAANIAAALVAVLVALIAFFAFIPGEQPEKALQAVVDFISKFSKK
jgi:hypothetical protein